MPGTRHKVSLVGLGAMGRRHARVLSALEARFDVVGGFDVRAERVAEAGLASLMGEADAIARADVVVVATPNAVHHGAAVRALAAGRRVLVEKPLCASAAEAEALASSAGARGALFVGHSERFNPVVRAVAKLVRGERVLSVDLRREGPSRLGEHGVLLNLGVHDLDLVAYLTGAAVDVRGAVGGEGRADVLVETTSGAVGHVRVDRTVPTRRRELVLATAAWIYEGDLLEHRLVRTARDTGARTEVPLPIEEPLLAQARALADALDGAPSRELATGTDGAAAVMLAEVASRLCASAEKLSVLERG